MKQFGFSRYLSVFLSVLMMVIAFPAFPIFAETGGTITEAAGNGAEAIATAYDGGYLYKTTVVTENGIPVTVKTYADPAQYGYTTAGGSPTAKPKTGTRLFETIVYSVNTRVERIGQDTDVDIVGDFLDEGYIVMVPDFGHHEKAVAGTLEGAIYNIKLAAQKHSSNKYLGELALKRTTVQDYWVFSMLAGYRMVRQVTYYNLLKHGPQGTADWILKAWNDTEGFTDKHYKIPACEYNDYQHGVFYEATHVEQLVRPDMYEPTKALPLDFDLGLHIIYPANPTRETPVYMAASSWEDREGGGSQNRWNDGLMARGYTYVVYDHEYIPMAREDHYGYFIGNYGYGMANYLGVSTHTAAVRCVRNLAATYGYSDYEGYSVSGASKAGYCSVLGSDEPNDRAEWRTFPEPYVCVKDSNGYEYGSDAQPNLTYSNPNSPKYGEKISARVQGVVSSVGDGLRRHEWIVTDDTSPTVMGVGKDDYNGGWEYWEACQETYMDKDVIHLAVGMPDKGHDVPHGIDPIYNYDRGAAVIEFLEYNANLPDRDVPVKLLYTYPVDGEGRYRGEDDILIHFSGPVPMSEVLSNIKIIDTADGSEMTGTWKDLAGDAKYVFTPSQNFISRHTYKLVIPATLKGDNGLAIGNPAEITFVSGADPTTPVIKDVLLTNGSEAAAGGADTITLTGENDRAYMEFDLSSFTQPLFKVRLGFRVENDAFNTVGVYAVAEDSAEVDEATAVWSSAPAIGQLIGSVPINGTGSYAVDITDYVAELSGKTVRLMMAAEADFRYSMDLEGDLELQKSTSNVNECISDTCHYRVGGAPDKLEISTTYNHTEGGSKSLKFTRKNDYDRFKLYNSITDDALTALDIGSVYEISAWVYSETAMNIQLGLMSANGEKTGRDMCGTNTTTWIPANTWTKCELTIKLTQAHIDEQAGMVTIQGHDSSKHPFYVDDIQVERKATSVTFASKEGAAADDARVEPFLYVTLQDGDFLCDGLFYDSLFDAVAAAEAISDSNNQVTITMMADTALDSAVSFSKDSNILLDLGGYTLTTDFADSRAMSVAGKLAIQNGTINDPQRCYELERSTIELAGTSAVLELLDGCHIITNADYAAVRVGTLNGTSANAHLIVNEGTRIDCYWYAIDAHTNGSVEIKGGTFVNEQRGSLLRFLKSDSYAPTRTITGGTFRAVDNPDHNLITQSGHLVITGGTFSNNRTAAAFLAPHYYLEQNADGAYDVVYREPTVSVAKIGSTEFSSLAEAIAALPTDGTLTTLTLLGDLEITSSVTFPKGTNVIFDLGGYTLTTNCNGSYGLKVHGDMVLKNGTIDDPISEPDSVTRYTIRAYPASDSDPITNFEFASDIKITSKAGWGAVLVGESGKKITRIRVIVREGAQLSSTVWYALDAAGCAEVTIEGGSFTSTATSSVRFQSVEYEKEDPADRDVEVRKVLGGTFTGKSSSGTFSAAVNVLLYGGTYNVKPPASIVAENCALQDGGSSPYTVINLNKDGEARIGYIYYATLADAMAALPTDGTETTITLLKDLTVTEVITFQAGVNAVLDLGGFSLTTDIAGAAGVIINGSLAIKNGTIIDPHQCNSDKRHTLWIQGENAHLNLLSDLTVDSTADYAPVGVGSSDLNVGGRFTMNDGVSLIGKHGYIINVYPKGSIRILGGSGTTSYMYGINLQNPTVNDPELRIISGGTFTSTHSSNKNAIHGNAKSLTVTGGTFSDTRIRDFVSGNYLAKANSDGTYTVVHAVAEINGTKYVTVAEAVRAVPTDNTETTITLIKDAAVTSLLTISENTKILLDLGGYTMTTDFAGDHAIRVKGYLAVKNGTIHDPQRGKEKNRRTIKVFASTDGKIAILELLSGANIISNADYAAVYVGYPDYSLTDGHIIVHDGVTMDCFFYSIEVNCMGTADIRGGTFINDDYGTCMTFRANSKDGTFSTDRYISGGSFTARTDDDYKVIQAVNGLTVTGGTFNDRSAEAAVADGYIFKDNGNGTYTVKAQPGFADVNISLGMDISVNYYVNDDAYIDPSVCFTMNGVSTTVQGVKLENGQYKFVYQGVAPQCIGDSIAAELIVGGETVDSITYSVLEYLNSLKSATATELGYSTEKYNAMLTLVADLLVYGGAAQTYKGHNTDASVSEGITGSEFVTIADTDLALTDNGTYVTFKGATVYFDSVNKLKFKLAADDMSGIVLTYSVGGVETEITDITDNGDGTYIIETDGIYAIKFDDVYTVTAYKDGAAGASLVYSIKSYAYSKQDGTDSMSELAKATYNYGLAAKAFKNAE